MNHLSTFALSKLGTQPTSEKNNFKDIMEWLYLTGIVSAQTGLRPTITYESYLEIPNYQLVMLKNVVVGDLIRYTNNNGKIIDIEIYIGNGQVIAQSVQGYCIKNVKGRGRRMAPQHIHILNENLL